MMDFAALLNSVNRTFTHCFEPVNLKPQMHWRRRWAIRLEEVKYPMSKQIPRWCQKMELYTESYHVKYCNFPIWSRSSLEQHKAFTFLALEYQLHAGWKLLQIPNIFKILCALKDYCWIIETKKNYVTQLL